MTHRILLASLLLLTARLAHADDIDVDAFEYVDVIETADGGTLRGVVVEQEPGVRYKLATSDGSVHVIAATDVVRLSKARNKTYRAPMAAAMTTDPTGGGATALGTRYERDRGLPAPYAHSGLRADFAATVLFPSGDVDFAETSFAPTVRVGYEHMMGPVGIAGGGQARFTYWMLSGETDDALWTLETHAYGAVYLHLGRVAPYAGFTLGTDLNYIYDDRSEMSDTTLGFGANVGAGVRIDATPSLAIDFGGEYHPATDSITSLVEDASIEYYSLRLGAQLQL